MHMRWCGNNTNYATYGANDVALFDVRMFLCMCACECDCGTILLAVSDFNAFISPALPFALFFIVDIHFLANGKREDWRRKRK